MPEHAISAARMTALAGARHALWPRSDEPSSGEMEALARAAFDDLPEAFRALCAEVVLRVADFPDPEDMRAVEAESRWDLLGLFVGEGLAHRSATPWTGQIPNTIYLYRLPILEFWADGEDTLGAIVTHVLVHEIGHHFGLSDEDMERIDDAPD